MSSVPYDSSPWTFRNSNFAALRPSTESSNTQRISCQSGATFPFSDDRLFGLEPRCWIFLFGATSPSTGFRPCTLGGKG